MKMTQLKKVNGRVYILDLEGGLYSFDYDGEELDPDTDIRHYDLGFKAIDFALHKLGEFYQLAVAAEDPYVQTYLVRRYPQ